MPLDYSEYTVKQSGYCHLPLEKKMECSIVVKLNLGDVSLQNFMLVEKVKHNFKNELHTMDLTLRGGEFIA